MAGGQAALRLPPDLPVLLVAHADGRPVGETVLDSGLPPAAATPGFWRADPPGEAMPDRLLPLAGAARTRADRRWLLADAGVVPEPCEGITLQPAEAAPGGLLWPLHGCGVVRVGQLALPVSTGAETEASSHRLHVVGRPLPGWRSEDGQLPLAGPPEYFGAEADGTLRRLDREVRTRWIARRLGGQVAEWREAGEVLARAGFLALPAGLRLNLLEIGPGQLRLAAEGLPPAWQARLEAAGAGATDRASADGRVLLTLTVPDRTPSSAG